MDGFGKTSKCQGNVGTIFLPQACRGIILNKLNLKWGRTLHGFYVFSCAIKHTVTNIIRLMHLETQIKIHTDVAHSETKLTAGLRRIIVTKIKDMPKRVK